MDIAKVAAIKKGQEIVYRSNGCRRNVQSVYECLGRQQMPRQQFGGNSLYVIR